MKTVMKKLLCLMLVAMMLVSAVPFAASAAEAVGFKYTIVIEGYSMEVVDADGTVTAAELYDFLEVSQGEDAALDAWIASKAGTDVKSGNVTLTVPAAGGSNGSGNSGNSGESQNPPAGGEGQPNEGQPEIDGEGQPDQSAIKCQLTIDYNLSGTPDSVVNATVGQLFKNYVGVPARNGYDFLGWYSEAYGKIIDITKDVVKGDDTLSGQWSAPKALFLTLDENRGAEETVNRGKTVYQGKPIGELPTPTREGYIFLGWKLNGEFINSNTIYDLGDSATAYAIWGQGTGTGTGTGTVIPEEDGKVWLEIYVNGKTGEMKKRVDITSLLKDEKITRSEVKTVVNKYITAKSGYSLQYEGLFDEESWYWYCRDPETDGVESITIETLKGEIYEDHYIYVMVNNVKNVAADTTNPKTGDMIFVPMAVMATAAAAAFVLLANKKRLVK